MHIVRPNRDLEPLRLRLGSDMAVLLSEAVPHRTNTGNVFCRKDMQRLSLTEWDRFVRGKARQRRVTMRDHNNNVQVFSTFDGPHPAATIMIGVLDQPIGTRPR